MGICTCQKGVNGNACSHQAAVALKFGINNANFIPQTANERFNLATLAVGSSHSFRVTQFVSLHQKGIENNPDYSGDCEIEEEMLPPLIDSDNGKQTEDNESSSTHPSEEMDIPECISLNEILGLHHEIFSTGSAQVTTTFASVISIIYHCAKKSFQNAEGKHP